MVGVCVVGPDPVKRMKENTIEREEQVNKLSND